MIQKHKDVIGSGTLLDLDNPKVDPPYKVKISYDGDRTFIGNAQPEFTFGFVNDFSYKGFDLSIFIQGVSGNEIVNFNKFLIERENTTSNVSLEYFANRWHME